MKKREEIEGVLLGSWKGITAYRCSFPGCNYDTLEKAKFIDHYARAHPPLEVIDGFDVPEPNPDVLDGVER